MSAAWPPDGKWMYFTANPGGVSHIWRQHFPNGRPEAITSGPTEEDGIAMAPDWHSFVTSVALQSTSLWVHDAKGEHQVSLEGNGTNPKFTPDGKELCYLLAKEATNDFAWYRNPGKLHCADLQSGRSELFQRGFPIQDYDISGDGQRVLMWTTGRDGKSQFLGDAVGSQECARPDSKCRGLVSGVWPRRRYLFSPCGKHLNICLPSSPRWHRSAKGFARSHICSCICLGWWAGRCHLGPRTLS